jgi:hypothetical protein
MQQLILHRRFLFQERMKPDDTKHPQNAAIAM